MEFRTIKEDGQVQEEIKKSRFICHAKRVYSEEEARDFITTIKKEHYKATHNCSAFIIGERSEIKRTSDDGEPRKSQPHQCLYGSDTLLWWH